MRNGALSFFPELFHAEYGIITETTGGTMMVPLLNLQCCKRWEVEWEWGYGVCCGWICNDGVFYFVIIQVQFYYKTRNRGKPTDYCVGSFGTKGNAIRNVVSILVLC